MSMSSEMLLLLLVPTAASAATPQNAPGVEQNDMDVESEIEEIVVTGRRVVTKTVTRTPVGSKVSELTLSYRVAFGDLDLKTNNGRTQLEQRVADAARAACKEIGRMYPTAEPSDNECTRVARERAMRDVRAVERLAAGKDAKGK